MSASLSLPAGNAGAGDAARANDDEDRLPTLRDWFQTSEDSTSDARAEGERARDYYDSKQLTEEERQALQARGQPPVIDNQVRPKISYLLGLEKRGRTDPRAFPRNPGDDEGANAATDGIRYVADDNRLEDTGNGVLENMLVEGYGGADVVVERGRDGKPKIRVEHYHWDRLFYDPHSRAYDFSDAKYLGGVVWMDEDGVARRWRVSKDDPVIAGAYDHTTAASNTYDDRPHQNVWADRKRKRVRVVQMHWQEGDDWWVATFTAGGFLEKPKPSPYRDEEGNSECSLILQSGYIDRDNTRYGIVRDMFDPQDEINKRRSKALHLLSVRQVILEQGAVEDVDAAREELAKPDGVIVTTPGMRFDIQQTADLAQGQFLLLQEAKQSMAGQGPNAFLQGKQGQAASGRAIMASQQGGAVEMDGAIMDRFHQWKRRVYRAIWNRIKQFWTEETWVRVTDDDRNIRFVGLNRPMTLEEKILTLPQQMQQQAVQYLGLQPGDPRLQQPYIGPDGQPELANNVARMDVDIIIDESPDVATLQVEQFAMLADLAGKMPGLIPPDALIEASQLRDKDKILEKIRPPVGPDGQPVPPPPPPEVLKAQAEMQLKQQQHADEMAMRQAEAQQKAQIEAARMQAQIVADQTRLEAELALQRERLAGELRLKEMELQARLELQRQEAAAKMQLSRAVAAEQADAKREEMAHRHEMMAGAEDPPSGLTDDRG